MMCLLYWRDHPPECVHYGYNSVASMPYCDLYTFSYHAPLEKIAWIGVAAILFLCYAFFTASAHHSFRAY